MQFLSSVLFLNLYDMAVNMFTRGVLLFILAFAFVPSLNAAQIVSQSSTAFSGVASRAVDQNTDGNYSAGSVTHTRTSFQPWWMIDLGEQTRIDSVNIYNRTNCCTDRLSNFYVFTSDLPFAHDDVDSTLNDPNVHSEFFAGAANPVNTITIGQDAQYLRIQLSGRAPLSLAEVVINEVPTVTVSQSSTGFGGVASRAYDQDTNGVYRGNSVTHTNTEVEPWWTIDLAEQKFVDSVDIYNRTDCCTTRLSDFYVFTSEQPFAHDDVGTTLSDPNVHSEFFVGAADPVNTIAIGQDARYLRIQLSGRAPLSLAEVVINEVATVTVSQSSTGFGGLASRAYDQDTNGVYRGNSVTHTNNTVEPWWTIDLAEQTDIGSVVIYNRTDCCTTRLSDFYVFTSEQPFAHNDVLSTLGDANVQHQFYSGPADAVNTISINDTARYLRVQLSGRNALSLAEVQIVESEVIPLPQVAALLAPLSTATFLAGDVIDFSWSASNLATQYDFELYDSNGTTSTALVSTLVLASECVDVTCSVSTQLLDNATDGSYSWRVRALNETGSSDWVSSTFAVLPPVVLPDPPSSPIAVSPIDGTDIDQGDTVTFVWNEVAVATSYDFGLYDVLSDSVGSVSEGLLAADICQNSLCSLTIDIALAAGQGHAWQVLASNDAGSSPLLRTSFNVLAPVTELPAAPVLSTPLAEAVIASGAQTTFSWSASSLASSYEFEIAGIGSAPSATDSDLNTVLFPDSCTALECSFSALVSLPAGYSYAWRVRATNSVGSSEWSASTLYVFEASTSRPVRPTPVSPIGVDVIEDSVFAFTWEHDHQVETYEFFLFDAKLDSPTNGELPRQVGLRAQDLCDGTLCSLDVEVTLPVFANQRWRLRGRNSAGPSDFTLTFFNVVELVTDPPAAPLILAPQQNSRLEIDSIASFNWRPSDTATSYEFRVLDLANANAVLISDTLPATRCTADECELNVELALPIAITYEWQARAINAAGQSAWSSTLFGTIKKATQRPATPVNVTPRTNAQIAQGDSVVFTWEPDADSVTYEFHFFDGGNNTTTEFIVGIQAESACDGERCSLTQLVDLPVAANHAWRVRGRNSLGSSLNWSRTTFEVIPTVTEAPGPFELTAPLNGSEVIEGEAVTFTWNRAQFATEYEFALFDGAEFTNAIETASLIHADCGTNFCSHTISSALAVSDGYTGRVRAINSIGQSSWQAKSFSIVAEPVILPVAPLAVAPVAGESVIVNQPVDFQWSADELAVTYDFYLTNSDGVQLPVVNGLEPETICAEGLCTYTAIPALPISGLNTWHVRAVHETVASEWSETLFAVIADINAETPVAIISTPGFASSVAGVAPFKVWFDPSESVANIDNELTEYLWSFGDGSSDETRQNESVEQHIYTEPGSYVVQLTVTDDSGLSGQASLSITVYDPATTPSNEAASRLLTQATFGSTRASILDVQSQGFESWLDKQFTLQGPDHLDYVRANSNGSNRAARHEIWWSDVARGDDQLRQRIAFTLSQIFVVADTGYTLSNAQFGITNYYDILRDHAFGNYRDLLEQVTLSPVMGLYLSMLQNAKSDEALSTRADENYAREVLQLFSIGLHQLNSDGTTSGAPVFTQDIIEGFARSFTGWNYADAGQWNRQPFTGADVISPMLPFQSFHDTEPKTLLNGVTTPANQGARADLEMALDNIFNHPNVGPFIVKQLITRLVTSNPTPAYVQRIAAVFNNDGNGVRGNLQAVVRALLLDDEARSTPSSNTYGKLREPVLRLSNLWRAFNIQPGSNSSGRGEFTTGSPALENLDQTTGQAVLKSPSVFNFFQPSFSPAGPIANSNLVAPEFELFTESNELATSNRIGRQIQEAYLGNPDTTGQRNAHLDFSYERWLATDPEELLNHLDTILMSGNLSDGFRAILLDHINGLPDTENGLSQRVRDAITLIMASPDYLVQM